MQRVREWSEVCVSKVLLSAQHTEDVSERRQSIHTASMTLALFVPDCRAQHAE